MGTGWLSSSQRQCISLYQLGTLVSTKIRLRTFWKSLLWELEYQILHLSEDPDLEFPLNLASLTLLLRSFTARPWHSLSPREFPGRSRMHFLAHLFLQESCCSAMLPWLPGTSCCFIPGSLPPHLPKCTLCPLVPFLFFTYFYVKITLPATPELWSTSMDATAGWSILLISFKCLCQNDHTVLDCFPNLQIHYWTNTFFWYLYMSPPFKNSF